MIAEHGISRSAQAGRLQEAVEALCRDKTRTKLHLNLVLCKELKDVTPLAKLGDLQSLQDFILDLERCSKLPESLQNFWTNKAEFAAACKGGADGHEGGDAEWPA